MFGAFEITHYRPKERPNSVKIVHPKNGEEAWWPLFDETGETLFPELMAEPDAIKETIITQPNRTGCNCGTKCRAQHARATRDRFRLKGMDCHHRPPRVEAHFRWPRMGILEKAERNFAQQVADLVRSVAYEKKDWDLP